MRLIPRVPHAKQSNYNAQKGRAMRRIQVDFNNIAGSGVLPVPRHGQVFSIGERLMVYDYGTLLYEAMVVCYSDTTVFLKVSDVGLTAS